MVSRQDRDELAGFLESYLKEEITAFVFDDKINDLGDRTQDATVSELVFWLWGFYDDCKDHHVVAHNDDWNLMQRLLLFLKTDLELVKGGGGETGATYRWSWGWQQLIAAACLPVFAWFVHRDGWGNNLLPVVWALGLISFALTKLNYFSRQHKLNQDNIRMVAVEPFASLKQIRRALKDYKPFRKMKYPKHLSNRKIRHWLVDSVMIANAYFWWFTLSPAALLFQCLPIRELKLPEGKTN